MRSGKAVSLRKLQAADTEILAQLANNKEIRDKMPLVLCN
jgi:hypothetical protein